MSRQLHLKSILRNNFTEQFINRFENSSFRSSRGEMFAQCAQKVLSALSQHDYDNPAILSSVLAEYLNEEVKLPIAVFAGELDYGKHRLFSVNQPYPLPNKAIIPSHWQETHFWIEGCGCIIDISLFRRIYKGHLSPELMNMLVQAFGPGRGALISTPAKLAKYGFTYTPHFSLSQYQIQQLKEMAYPSQLEKASEGRQL